MRLSGTRQATKLALMLLFISGLFLLSSESIAASSFTDSSSFESAGTSPPKNYMDQAGTWDNDTHTDATDTTGDTFTYTFTNDGPDTAFDYDLILDVPNGFRLPAGVNNVDVIALTPAITDCDTLTNRSVTQSSVGADILIDIPNNQDIPENCSYQVQIGLTTNHQPPLASPCNAGDAACDVTLIVEYNEINNNFSTLNTHSITHQATVATTDLTLTKTADIAVASNGEAVNFTVDLISSGTGGAFDVLFTDTISANLTGLTIASVEAFDNTSGAPFNDLQFSIGTGPFSNTVDIEYIPENIRVTISVNTFATVDPADTTCPDMTNDATAVEQRTGVTASDFATVDFSLAGSLQLTHELVSYCELCGPGVVQLTAENIGGISLVNISLTQDLLASGLTYVNGTTQISLDGGPAVPAGNPVVSGADSQILTWTSAQVPELAQLDSPFATPAPPNATSIRFIFEVERAPGFDEEGLQSANRNIQHSADYELICGGISENVSGVPTELSIRQPIPITTKLGRNIDAGQGTNAYDPFVYGHVEDRVIWRVEVSNVGPLTSIADMQDLLISDTITGNFDIDWICIDEASATAASTANTGTASGCETPGGGAISTTVPNFEVDDPYGTPGNDENTTFIDVTAGGSGFVYYVGRIQEHCTDHQNTANIEWGCEVDSPDGGLASPASNNGITPTHSIVSTADLSAEMVSGGLNIQQALTGVNVNQPVGSSGLVTIQITNQTGATIRDLVVNNTLPPEYVVDATFTPTAVVAPAYGNNYLGMIDIITWDNEDGNPLNNTAPQFTLTSSTQRVENTVAGDDRHLLRNGDVLTIQFRIVLIDAPRYDLAADMDVAQEVQADNTDPDSDFTVTNSVDVTFENICSPVNRVTLNSTENFPADIEDLDISISDPLFILTNDPLTPLPLNVSMINNGGHDADNYLLYVTFGDAMTVTTVPVGCTGPTSNPPPHPLWNDPTHIPPTATTYACYRNIISPGITEVFTFEVIRDGTAFDDDLLFRADVVGEITLSDGAALTFPVPGSTTTTPALQLANNYTLDSVRSKVLGFNLTKQVWYCTESGVAEPPANDPPAATPAELNIQIGEDCNYFIKAGGWFGFETAGFDLIEVENIVVTDDLPDGQGMIPFSAIETYKFNNDTGITLIDPVTGGAGTTPLDETDINWTFNTTALGGITIKDKFFRVDLKTRLLNDSVDLAYPVPVGFGPNLHGENVAAGNTLSTNIARASFDAIFDTAGVVTRIPVDDAAGIPGYPVQSIRQVDLTEVEPNLTVVKEVCNETLNGVGPSCSRFVPAIGAGDVADAGDSDDNYIYRITITNEAAALGVARSPAFNVEITDTLDASDLMGIAPVTDPVAPFSSDGLDNDGDGDIDGADTDGEFFSLTENVPDGVAPAVFVISHEHSDALDRIDAGTSVTYYYRIDPDDAVAPLQTLSNTVATIYDSLEGDFGNQNPPQLTNGEDTFPNNTGRARIYTAPQADSSIQMLPLQTLPKAVITLSNTPAPASGPREVVVGEEIRYELHTLIPIANLRNFVIRDELPPGIRCMDSPVLELNSSNSSGTGRDYAAAGFVPGGNITPTCTSTGTNDVVEWNLGNQELTSGVPGQLYDFEIDFTARVENTAQIQEGCIIRNGGSTGSGAVPAPTPCTASPTLARGTYVDDNGATITINYAEVDVIVREPVIDVTKSFAPVTEADADDLLDITVTATNNGTATAYNLQILDDLVGSKLSFQSAVAPGGTDPPDNVDVATLGINQPIFSWDPANPDFAIAVGEVKTFTFRVQVDADVQPLEILDNTIEARWTSLPSINTALPEIGSGNARTLDADGEPQGMRNGQLSGVLPSSINPPNDYNHSAADQVVVPQATITKNDLNPALVPEIGALKQFEIILDFPEGITENVIVTDNLNASTVSYFIENNADYDITYTFNGIETINGVAPSEQAFADPLVNTDGFPADNTSGSISWQIGQVNTLERDDSAGGEIDRQIIINYFARINNDTDTDDGDTLQNGATFNYTNGEDPLVTEVETDDTPEITVVEPLLTLAKTVSNITQPGIAPDAGDILEYIITINNTGSATAYDVNIVDTIAAGIELDGATPVTALLDGVAVTDFDPIPLNNPVGPLIWGRGNITLANPDGDLSLDIPANAELVLTYRSVVQDTVRPSQVLDNQVVIDWTSLNDSDPLDLIRERDGGADCSAIVQPDDYCAGPVVASLVAANNNTITKAYTSDTFAPLDDAILRVGDRVTYTVTLGLQEGSINNIQIQDTLPNGLEFVGVDSINGVSSTVAFPGNTYSDAAVPFEYVGDNLIDEADFVVATGAGDNILEFNIGNVIVDSDNVTANNNFEIVYTAQVVAAEFPIPQSTSTVLSNQVTLSYLDAFSNPPATAITSTASITVQEPEILLSGVIKERYNAAYTMVIPSGSLAASASRVYFRMQVCNSGDAPAYEVIVTDDLDPDATVVGELDLTTISGIANGPLVPDVYIDGALVTQGVDYSYSLAASTMTFTLLGDTAIPAVSDPDNCMIIEYSVEVDAGLGGGFDWDNSLLLDQYASLPNPGTEPIELVNERQVYTTDVGPVLVNMHTIGNIEDPSKAFVSIDRPDINPAPITVRDPYYAAVGELVTYRMVIPDVAMGQTLHNVLVIDDMHPSLEFVSASLVVTGATDYGFVAGETINSALSSGNQVRIQLDQSLIASDRATIDVIARVVNNADANISTADFGNGVRYEFTNTPAGSTILGGSASTDPLNDIFIVEPQLDTVINPPTKTVSNLTKALPNVDAGDILEYTISFSFLGGAANDRYSDAYDLSIIDTLGAGLTYLPGSASTSIGIISDPGISGSILSFNIANGTDIDVPEGTINSTITYQVRVDDSVLANQVLSNSAIIQWTSLDDNIADVDEVTERNGTGGLNDYFSTTLTTSVTTTDTNTMTKVWLADTSPALNANNDVRIGDIVDYQLTLNLQEGTSQTVILSDVLPQGLKFEGVVSINGDTLAPYANAAPFTHLDINLADITVTGDPVTGPTTVSWDLGNITNAGFNDLNDGNNDFVIVYRTRVLNLVQIPLDYPSSNIALTNTLSFDYLTASGAAVTQTDTETVTIQQPNLSITKSVATQFTDLIIEAGEQIYYTVDIINAGESPAYDVRLEDVIPVGLRQNGITILTVEQPVGVVLATSPTVTLDPLSGLAVIDFDSGTADEFNIPAGETLRISYQLIADAGIGAGQSNIINTAVVPAYYSFDDEAVPVAGAVTGVREIYGPTNTASAAALTTGAPNPLDKANPAQLTQSIGVPFSYTITVPDVPQGTALYDVKILDDLSNLAPNVDLVFVSAQKLSATGSWDPVNTGTAKNIVLEDVVNGIDIPAGEQAVIEVTVVLQNTSNNEDGDSFVNLASYTYNSTNDDAATQQVGGADSDVALTIVEPTAMLLQKSGPPSMQYGIAGTFTLDVQNMGAGPAYDISITDQLPNPVSGGMCDTTPTNFTAQVFEADGVTPVSIPLVENTHFVTSYTAAPECTLVISMTAAEAVLQPLNRLIVTFDGQLDLDNRFGSTLDNVAGVTQWFSADTPNGEVVGEVREYNELISLTAPGTPGVDDHQDVYQFSIDAADLEIIKTVEFPGGGSVMFAEPTDVLRYYIQITNNGNVDAVNFSLLDEPDVLNLPDGYFVPGSLANVTVPVGAIDNSDAALGANGAGLVDVSNLNLAAGGDSLLVSFDVTLISIIDAGTVVKNQASVMLEGFNLLLSDNDNDPISIETTDTIIGSQPFFQTFKTSEDISGDLNLLEAGDILQYTITAKNIGVENAVDAYMRDQIPANTRYVANSTTLNGLSILDPEPGVSPLEQGMLIHAPENTTPGVMRADNTNSTDNIATVTFSVQLEPGVVNGAVISNQAFIGGLGAGSGPFPEQASDDPDTDITGDPTRDVVGNVAILDVQAEVRLLIDVVDNDQVDPGDTLRYTVTVNNSGNIAANGVVLSMASPQTVVYTLGMPLYTTYVANSTRLNGVTIADNGLNSPITLTDAIDISSDDLSLPVQNDGNPDGIMSPGQSAVLIYDVTVDATAPLGDVIKNQLEISSFEFPDELTDEDGNDLNGDQITEVVIGSDKQLSISTEVMVVGGGTAQPGDLLEYFVHVQNTGTTEFNFDTSGLSGPLDTVELFIDVNSANNLTYIPGSVRLNGVDDPIHIDDSSVSNQIHVDYDSAYAGPDARFDLDPGDSFTVRYLAQINIAATQGTTLTNRAGVEYAAGATLSESCSLGSVSLISDLDACSRIDLGVGGAPGVATISGNVWHDGNLNEIITAGERLLPNWEVEIYVGSSTSNIIVPGNYLDSVFTDENGFFVAQGLVANTGTSNNLSYAVKYIAPGTIVGSTASLGTANSPFISSNDLQSVTRFDVVMNSHTTSMNLPIQPNGVVYDSVFRTAVANSRLRLVNNDNGGNYVPESCFADVAQDDQLTTDTGYYKFELLFNDAVNCDINHSYSIEVTPPDGYFDSDGDPATPYVSAIIPPLLPLTDPAYDAVSCPGDALPVTQPDGTPECEVQISEYIADTSIAPRSSETNYYLKFLFANGLGDDQIFNNHIPVDPEIDSALTISKITPMVNVNRGQLVPYTITVTNTLDVPLYDVNIVDMIPPGFKYISDSARIKFGNGAWQKSEPLASAGTAVIPDSILVQGIQPEDIVGVENAAELEQITRLLSWDDIGLLNGSESATLNLLLVVGSGVGEGEYVNRALSSNFATGGAMSGVATATVRVVPDPTFDCSDVIGKVFDDQNLNAYQDEGEPGLANVRVLTARGLEITTDAHGRFHLACAAVPNPDRGSNFIIKLDERSLPSGYRLTTENPRVVRATRGKMTKFNFGAAIHRVVRLDMADAVFEPETTEMRPQWLPRLDLLISELAKDPSILRLSYLAENETSAQVNQRLDVVRKEIESRWNALNCCYQLTIETEVFWRKGGEPDRGIIDE